MTHEALVGRGATWLQRTMRCEPVLYGLSSGPEIPDVVGWSSRWQNRGSIVLECKASRSDFLRDKKKKQTARMGDYRYIVCAEGLLSAEDVATHAPEHGLLWFSGASLRAKVVVDAPRRAGVNYKAETRHLRMALIHVSYNIAAHGFDVHMPTLSKWNASHGMRPVSKTPTAP